MAFDDNKIEFVAGPGGMISFLIAFFTVQIYFLSPLIFIIRYEKKQIELKEFPFIQVFFNLLNCYAHVIYAYLGYGSLETFINNSVGLAVSLGVFVRAWVALYKRDLKSIWLYLFVVVNIIFQSCFFATRIKQMETLSLLSLTLNILMYLSTNQNVIFAIRTQDSSKIPIVSAIFGLISSIFWIVWYSYGVRVVEETLQKERRGVNNFANGISIFCLLVPISLYIFLRKKNNPKKDDNLNIQGNQ